MSKRASKRLPHDFHLWTSVAATVEPLRRKGLLKLGAGTLPQPELEPAPLVKAPPKPLKPGKPFLPAYQAPAPGRSIAEKAVDPAIHKKVRRGRIDIDGRIDLHGMTQTVAREALRQYIANCAARGDRTILVITGKGARTDNDYVAAMTERGILRTMLPIWLSEPGLAHLISGWSLAARGHGGDGAWYVRLRRQ
ncbi:Smr/MutS family protein [Devosia sp. XJ19-1]|uniref:Smr/MutS family protein n=1 Tax=Devosia ureilytica TaxID=2952754 RepID=A0A9Q4AN47_9HYPH|nr:Smr/MutS family protein [Devosia ureilytica]MCP8882902.1 Smr/MutS family protein [Devosia ureilytica]MCP8886730.1 Smr/MutS family protein [Devosia ureilytica]